MKLSTPASTQRVFLEKLTLDKIAQHPVKGLILKNLLKDFDSKSCSILSMIKLPMKTCYAVSWNFMFFRFGIFYFSLNLCK